MLACLHRVIVQFSMTSTIHENFVLSQQENDFVRDNAKGLKRKWQNMIRKIIFLNTFLR